MQRIIPHGIENKGGLAPSGTANTLFFVVGMLLFFLVLLAAGALFLLERSQGASQDILRNEIDSKRTELASGVVDQAMVLDARLNNMEKVLDGHLFSSNALRFAEEIAHPQVRFGNFSFTNSTRSLDMSANGKTYSVVAQQIDILKNDPNVEKVEFGGLSLSKTGGVDFSLLITFTPMFATTLFGPDFGLPITQNASPAPTTPAGAIPINDSEITAE